MQEKMDETLIGGFIAAIFSFSQTLSSGIDSISLGEMIMHYATSSGLITCLGVEKKTKDQVAREVVKKIHDNFLEKYQSSLSNGHVLDGDFFLPFRSIYLDILQDFKLLPKEISKTRPDDNNFDTNSNKITTLIQGIAKNEDPKKIVDELKSIFVLLGKGKEGKELRRTLVDFDKFIKKMSISEQNQKNLFCLVGELRSFAAIDEWLG